MSNFGFSWKKAVGITAAKRKFSKATGIPTTKSGRKNKIKNLTSVSLNIGSKKSSQNESGCGCLLIIIVIVIYFVCC